MRRSDFRHGNVYLSWGMGGTQEELVFMLGGGVNQYINDKLSNHKLLTVPHALHMDAHDKFQHYIY